MKLSIMTSQGSRTPRTDADALLPPSAFGRVTGRNCEEFIPSVNYRKRVTKARRRRKQVAREGQCDVSSLAPRAWEQK